MTNATMPEFPDIAPTDDWDSVLDCINTYTEAYAAAKVREAMGWQPIDTAPKDGTSVIVWFKQHGAMSVHWTDRNGDAGSEYAHWHVDDHKHGPYPVRGYCGGDDTHWMPLPPPPTQ